MDIKIKRRMISHKSFYLKLNLYHRNCVILKFCKIRWIYLILKIDIDISFFRIQQDEKTKNISALIEKEKVKKNLIIHMMKLNIKIFFF